MYSSKFILVIYLAVVCRAYAYGPLGHEIVGAIADRKLAGTPTAEKIRTLLDGISLERASLIAD
ncbi:MAG: S1/P1 Nuclease, partial [Verrucomicrobia bacterium]